MIAGVKCLIIDNDNIHDVENSPSSDIQPLLLKLLVHTQNILIDYKWSKI